MLVGLNAPKWNSILVIMRSLLGQRNAGELDALLKLKNWDIPLAFCWLLGKLSVCFDPGYKAQTGCKAIPWKPCGKSLLWSRVWRDSIDWLTTSKAKCMSWPFWALTEVEVFGSIVNQSMMNNLVNLCPFFDTLCIHWHCISFWVSS